ncbi:MAG: hypothetical protein O7A69_14020, partial [SAR324 cluster bacterium]|nr:hypothetical protein [SAR324 cluster bacterium]
HSVIESGKFKLELTNANVSQVTAERAELMAINAEEKGIALSTEIYEVPKATAAARGLRPLPVTPFAEGFRSGSATEMSRNTHSTLPRLDEKSTIGSPSAIRR